LQKINWTGNIREYGNYNDMVELLNLAKRGVINPIISKRYSLSEANVALEDLKSRKILGRAIINP
ncbi:MAG: zinc-binding dehydrogenase, partial [Candidatus Nitrosotenuis sp.]